MGDDARPPASPRAPHALLAGGGSGGHIFPALAVGAALAARGWRVSFAGAATGMEARLVPERGIPFHALPARPWVGRGPLAKLGALATLARSAAAARRLVRGQGIDLVIGTGGYVSAPAVLGARLAGRQALLVEPNAAPGVANRWLSRLAAGAAVAHPATARGLACPCRVTGVPVRAELAEVPALDAERAPLTLLALGGSQGARRINEALPAAVAALPAALRAGLCVRHQCGAAAVEATRQRCAALALAPASYDVLPFIDDVAAALAAADLVVSRAGAITLAELSATGRPALLLPLDLAGGHQIDNARLLAEAGAARVLRAAEATSERLAGELSDLLGDRARLVAMGAAARALARPGAAAAIADFAAELLPAHRRRAA